MSQNPEMTEPSQGLDKLIGGIDHIADVYGAKLPAWAAPRLRDAISELRRLKDVESDLLETRKLVTRYAREAGEATGRLEMSEAAGIVDGWRERAEAAESRASALQAQLDAMLSAAPPHQGEKG